MVEYEFAYRDGKIVSAKDAEKGIDHRCPVCDANLRARSTENVIAHFYHYKKEKCTASKESILHSNSKFLLYSRLNEYLSNGKDLKCFLKCVSDGIEYNTIKYGIDSSNGKYILNTIIPKNFKNEIFLLDNVDSLGLETKKGNLVPDISLMKNNNLVKSIEIIHTHDDNELKKETYRKMGIDVLYVYIKTDSDYDILKKCVESMDESISQYILNNGIGCGYAIITTKDMLIFNCNQRKSQDEYWRHEKPGRKEFVEWQRQRRQVQEQNQNNKIEQTLYFEKANNRNYFSTTAFKNRYIGLNLADDTRKYKYLLDEIENNTYDHFCTIAGIARQCNIGIFDENVAILEHFVENGIIAIINQKYEIHKNFILNIENS